MTADATVLPTATANPGRLRLSRAGVFNVWQYDQQVFRFADGRLLLRGTNGAGKSKTLEMLLPFVLDGDSASMDATGRRGATLLWLMSEGVTSGAATRIGYVWVEFARTGDDGAVHRRTFGVGLRMGASARQVTKWYFTTTRAVDPGDLRLDGADGPLTRGALEQEIGDTGRVFDRSADYRAHVGQSLFGLDPERYDDLLRLLYWLRRPQVGEDIDPRKITTMLTQSLPAVPDQVLRQVGATLDELTAFGEKISRREQALEGLSALAAVFTRYATGIVAERAEALVRAAADHAAAGQDHTRLAAERDALAQQLRAEEAAAGRAKAAAERATATLRELERSAGADRRRELELMQQAAEQARRTAGELADQARRDSDRAASSDRDAVAETETLRGVDADLRAALDTLIATAERFALPPPSPPRPPDWSTPPAEPPAAAAELTASWARVADSLPELTDGLNTAWALLTDVLQALDEVDRTLAVMRADERESAAADARSEQAEGRLSDATRAAETAESAYLATIRAWVDDPAAKDVDTAPLVDDPAFDADRVQHLPAAAREASADLERALSDRRAEQAAIAGSQRAEQARLSAERERVAAERDPAPAAPTWQRDPRDPAMALPLWRVVDVAPGLDAGQQARLESALEASGLLDALVLPDGALLDAGTRDVVLRPGAALRSGHLGELLVPDVPADAPVTEATVATLLRSIAAGSGWGTPAGDDGTDGDGRSAGGDGRAGRSAGDERSAEVGVDGAFRLGPLRGRSSKPAAQFLGATARAAERARRLAVLDEAIAASSAAAEQAEQAAAALAKRLQQLRDWLRATPNGTELLRAWQLLDSRTEQRDEARVQADEAARRAEASRAAHHRAQQAAQDRAGRAGVSPDRALVQARRGEVDDGRRRTEDLTHRLSGVGRAVQRWSAALGRAIVDRSQAEAADRRASEAEQAADLAGTSYQAAREAADPELRDLAAKIATATSTRDKARADEDRLRRSREVLLPRHGKAEQQVEDAERAERTTADSVTAAESRLRALAHVTGLLDAAFQGAEIREPAIPRPGAATTDPDGDGDGDSHPSRTPSPVGALASAAPGPAVLRLARSWLKQCRGRPTADQATLLQAREVASSSAAADADPRMIGEHDLWSVQAEHAGRTGPITGIVALLAGSVAEDRKLLTDKERRLFEEHLLGDLGEAMRARLAESTELVEQTNRILSEVSTSQGIKVRLDWKVRDDAAAGPAEAIRLLRRMSQLSTDERGRLRDLMHGIIEAARAAAPELSYTEHLASAMDYRSWHDFSVRITRPEWGGDYRALRRTTGLSQGEQKVVCYVPLFAAAAAHFTSVAGASQPHAPRFILLDDAFPKIDVRTHPLLFGLLVQLDLDFVITSERLWGDTPELPSLAIYETLRSPGEVGIAQFEYRWDGRRRTVASQ